MNPEFSCVAIDLKSFYASVECVARGLDAMGVNLIVADPTRTEKTICLAVSPALKAYGIPGRIRLFELIRRVRDVNAERLLPDAEFIALLGFRVALCLAPEDGCREPDSVDDLPVSCAPADISLNGLPDLFLGRIRIPVD